MDCHAVLFTGGIGASLVIAHLLRSQDTSVSRELAAKFEQTSRWGYLKGDFHQIAPLDRAGSLKIETT